jgi:hypothetical protein
VVAGALLADFDRRWRAHGLAPPLLAVTAAGIYATVPDVEAALVVLGATLPVALLGWPGRWRRGTAAAASPPPSLGVVGALAVAGLLAWTVAAGGAGRPGSVVGGSLCLGVLAVEPLARLVEPRRRSALLRGPVGLTALGAHLVLVAVAARVVGRAETVVAALPAAGLTLAAALAVALAAATAGERIPPSAKST